MIPSVHNPTLTCNSKLPLPFQSCFISFTGCVELNLLLSTIVMSFGFLRTFTSVVFYPLVALFTVIHTQWYTFIHISVFPFRRELDISETMSYFQSLYYERLFTLHLLA